jgi:hypothetical protein
LLDLTDGSNLKAYMEKKLLDLTDRSMPGRLDHARFSLLPAGKLRNTQMQAKARRSCKHTRSKTKSAIRTQDLLGKEAQK